MTVTPGIATGFSSDVGVSGALTFTYANWRTPQTVTVTANQDADRVNDHAMITHTVSSSDTNYSDLFVKYIPVVVIDDECGSPAAPTLTVTAGVGLASLSWTAGSDGGVAIRGWQYRHAAGSGSGGYGRWMNVTGGGSARAHTVSSLPPGTRRFQVRAVNPAGVGAESAAVSVTVTAPAVSASALAESATLALGTWTQAWWYKADKAPHTSCSAEVAAGTKTASLLGLSHDTEYTYTAYSKAGCAAADSLGSVAFRTVGLAARTQSGTNLLSVTNWAGGWWFRGGQGGASCTAVPAGTLTASMEALTAGVSYTYKVYKASGCESGDLIGTLTFTAKTDYDADADGLIEVATLEQLSAVRWDLDGDGSPSSGGATSYAAAFPHAESKPASMGCRSEGCFGYELAKSLDFDDDASYASPGTSVSGNKKDWTTGTGWTPLGDSTTGFTATFDGNGRAVANLYINRPTVEEASNSQGLFGLVGGTGEVLRLGVAGTSVTGSASVGALVGSNVGTIRHSWSTTGASEQIRGAWSHIGGLVGANHGTIAASASAADVSSSRNAADVHVGGLAGSNNGSARIVAASAAGAVAGGTAGNYGGLVGNHAGGSVAASYATGAVTGTGTSVKGGLIGKTDTGATVSASYWDSETTGIDDDGDTAAPEGRTTSELQLPTGYAGPYAGWNVDVDGDGTSGDDPWHFGGSGDDYPKLGALPLLGAADVAGTEATLALSNWADAWWYRAASGPDASCSLKVAAREALRVDLSGLSADTKYVYTAYMDAACSAELAVARFKTLGAPRSPSKPTATTGDERAVLSWTAGADGGSPVTGWQVATKAGDGAWGAWTDIADSGPETVGHTVTGLTNGTKYKFKVRAVNAVGNGASSPASDAVTPSLSAATAPPAPGKPTVFADDGGMTLSWKSNGDGGSAIIRWEYAKKVGIGTFGEWTAIADGGPKTTGHRIAATGLTAATAHKFKVRAVNAVGAGEESPASDAATLPALSASVTSGVAATLTLSHHGAAWRYKADRGPHTSCSAEVASGTPTASLTGLAEGHTYTYTAYGDSVCETRLAGVTLRTPKLTAASTGLTAGTLTLSNWSAIWRYKATSGGGPDTSCSTEVAAGTSSQTLTNLVAGTVYTYTAYSDAACSKALSSATFTAGRMDYDADGDGLVEISTLEQLNAMRWDLDGDGSPTGDGGKYALAFPRAVTTPGNLGCPSTHCRGYELARSLNFNDAASYASPGDSTSGNKKDWTTGTGWTPVGDKNTSTKFKTTFRGNGRVIANLFVDRPGSDQQGLFGVVGYDGKVMELGVVGASVRGRKEVGALAGANEGRVRKAWSNTGASEKIEAVSGRVGGLVGRNGGLVQVGSSEAAVSLSASNRSSGEGISGGLVGLNQKYVIAGHAAGAVVNDDDMAGGLVGKHVYGRIEASYATGPVTLVHGTAKGGLVGKVDILFDEDANIAASYWDSQTTRIDDDGDGDAPEGRTTFDLQWPTGYTGIYREWDVGIYTRSGGNLVRLVGSGDLWRFGGTLEYPKLKHLPRLEASAVTAEAGTLTLENWPEAWWHKGSGGSAVCVGAAAGTKTVRLSGLAPSAPHAYGAYMDSACSAKLATALFATIAPELASSSVTDAGARLTLSGWSSAWWHKGDQTSARCLAVPANSATADIAGLGPGKSYVYRAYDDGTCSKVLATAAFTTPKLASSLVTDTGARLTISNRSGAWWYKGGQSGATCTPVAANTATADVSGLVPGDAYVYKAYGASGCASSSRIATASFSTPKLASSLVTDTGARLTISNHSAAWWYKGSQSGATCTSVAANTAAADVSGLVPGDAYVYKAYGASGCATSSRIATTSSFSTPKLASSLVTDTGARLTMSNHSAAWWYKGSQSGATCTSVAANTATADVSGLDPRTTYTYKAYDASGCASSDRLATAAAFTTPDTTKPTLSSAAANGTAVTLTFSEALDTSSVPAATAFEVKVGGAVSELATSGAVSIVGAAVTLTLKNSLTSGATVTASYAKPATGNKLRDLGTPANEADSFTDEAVTNTTPDTTKPTLSSATANGTAVTLTFSEALDESSVPADSAFTVKVNNTAAGLAASGAVSISGAAVALRLSLSLARDDVVTASYAKPATGNKLRDLGTPTKNEADSFTDEAVTNNTKAALAVAVTGPTTATLKLSHWGGAWRYKATSGGGPHTSCSAEVTAGTSTASLTNLTAGTDYTYTAYSDAACSNANKLSSSTFTSGKTDYDADDNGLIEIRTLEQLNAVRWDLDGDGSSTNAGHAAAFPNALATPGNMGCPATHCKGYELATSLDFDDDASYASPGTGASGNKKDWTTDSGWNPIGSIFGGFSATFQGNGQVIANLYINRSDQGVGLFALLAAGGEVLRLGLPSASVKASHALGALTGANQGTIRHVWSSTGPAEKIEGVGGAGGVGGLVGTHLGGVIAGSRSSATVLQSAGLTGVGELVGGLVGAVAGPIVASHADGAVTNSVGLAGALAGLGKKGGSITASYAVGAVTRQGATDGGLIGSTGSEFGSVSDSYWDISGTGIADDADTAAPEGRTTAQLQSPTGYADLYQHWNVDIGLDGNFTDGDEDDPWHFGAARDYPRLKGLPRLDAGGYGVSGVSLSATLTLADWGGDWWYKADKAPHANCSLKVAAGTAASLSGLSAVDAYTYRAYMDAACSVELASAVLPVAVSLDAGAVTDRTATLTISSVYSGQWWYKGSQTAAVCTSVAGGTRSVDLSGLEAGETLTYRAYGKAGCASADELASATFATLKLAVSASSVTAATLAISNHSAAWWYKGSQSDATCTSVAADTATANLSGLTPGDSYTYKAYGKANCADENLIATAAALTMPNVVASAVTQTTATLSITDWSVAWWYKGDQLNASCVKVAAETKTASVSTLTHSTPYTYKVYSASGCAGANRIGTVTFTTLAPPGLKAADVWAEGATLKISRWSAAWWHKGDQTNASCVKVAAGTDTASLTSLTHSTPYTYNAYDKANCAAQDKIGTVTFTTPAPPGLAAVDVSATGATLALSRWGVGWWHKGSQANATCAAVAGGTSRVDLSNLTPGQSYTYKAYGKADCAASNLIATAAPFTTPTPALAASAAEETTATLTITNWSAAWRHKGTHADAVCSGEIAADTSTAELASLTGNTSYTYKAYSDTACSNVLATAPAFATKPPKPSKPTLSGAGEGKLALSAAVTGTAALVRWQYKKNKGGSGFDAGWTSVAGTSRTLSHTVSGLTDGTKYRFKVRAVNAAGAGATSDQSDEAEPKDNLPSFAEGASIGDQVYVKGSAITALTLPAATSGDAPLTYSLTPNLPSGLTFTAATRRITGTPSLTKTRTNYTYTVTDDDGDTDTLTFDLEVVAVTLTTSDEGATKATLTIGSYSSYGGAWHYKYVGGTCSSAVVAGTSSATATGLSPDTAHVFKAYSDSGCTTELATAPSFTTLMAKLSNVGVSARDRSLAVSWDAQTGATGYDVQWKSGAEEWDSATRQASVTPGTKTGHTIPTLTNSTEYTVRARSKKTGNTGEWSDEAKGTPADETLTVTNIASTGATLTIGNHGGSWYYKHTTPSSGTCSSAVATASTAATGLDADTAHVFKAYSDSGCATELATASSFTTLMAKLSNVSVAARDGALAVSWDAQTGATGYDVQWKSGAEEWDSATRQASVTPGTKTGHTIPTLTNSTEYTVRARSKKTGNTGEWSDEAKGTPADETLTVSNIASTGATLTIGNHSGDWYYKHTTPSSGTCSSAVATASTAATGLSPDTAHVFKAYSDSGCATELATASSFTTLMAKLSNVSVAARDGALAVSWDAQTGATGYDVQWKSGAEEWDSATRQASVAPGTKTGHTIPTLTNSTEYTVRARSKKTGNTGEWSDEAKGTPADETLTVSNIASTGATLTIGNHSGDWYYKHTTPSTGTCSSAVATASTAVSGLNADTAHVFKAYSDSACSTELAASSSFTTLMAKLSNVSVSARDKSLAVSWDAQSNATGYDVQWRSGAQTWDATRQASVTPGAKTGHTIPSLTNAVEYTVRARSKRTGNTGEWSDIATATPGDETLTVSDIASTTATLTIGNYSGNWHHRHTTPSTGPGASCSATAVPAGTDNTTVSGLSPDTAHVFKAYSDGGCATLLATASSFTTLMAKVSNVAVAARDKSLAVSWTAQSNATGYDVQWRSGNEDWDSATRQDAVASGTATGHTIAGLTNATEYTVRARSKRTGNEGEWSDAATGTPADETLTVTADNAAGGATLAIGNHGGAWWYKRASPTGDDTCHAVAAPATTATLSGLVAGTSYAYKAYGKAGCNAADEIASATFAAVNDYDADDDGLVEVASLAQLNAVRWDLDGDGAASGGNGTAYAAAFPRAESNMGCDEDGTKPACVGYELAADLDFDTGAAGDRTDDAYYNAGAGWTPIGDASNHFAATFDGGGRKLSNLHVNASTTVEDANVDLGGLFAVIGKGGAVSSLGLEDVSVTVSSTEEDAIQAGALAGDNRGTVTGVWSTGSVTASTKRVGTASWVYAGGLAGRNDKGGSGDAAYTGTIRASHSRAAVSARGRSNASNNAFGASAGAGGLVGNNKGTIAASYAAGDAEATHSDPAFGLKLHEGAAGGLVGINKGTVTAAYAIGDASVDVAPPAHNEQGNARIGGLVGFNTSSGAVAAGYSTGSVTQTGDRNTKMGGLVGRNDGAVSNSYWDTAASGIALSAAGTGKTTAELRAPTAYGGIYAAWNVDVDGVSGDDDPWDFGAATQYPVLEYGALLPPADDQRPRSLAASAVTSTGATLTIGNHSGNWHYRRATPSGGTCSSAVSTASATVSGLDADTAHVFKAYPDGNCATELASSSFTTLLAKVSNVSVSARDGALAVTWDAQSNATGYDVQWKSGNEDWDSSRQAS